MRPFMRGIHLVRRYRLVSITAALMLTTTRPALAVTQFQKSAYTTIDLKLCEVAGITANGTVFICRGLDGYAISLAEVNGRTFMAAGINPQKTMAATQALKATNTPLRKSGRATVEWRFTLKDQRRVPYAMIVRYFTRSDTAMGEVLVVTKIAGNVACHVAYIDALANSDAIVLARQIADDRARSFDCVTPATIEGAVGNSPL